ncbi:RNA polymerase sigma factor [bacterium]|nr:RNA polymerase sigma factor [bacterium]
MDVRKAIRDRRHASLLRQAGRGDTKAFGSLFRELHGPVFAYLDRRLPDVHDTEDLVATVFHKLLKNLANHDPRKGSVTAWLMTMARHALIDHLRRRRDMVDMDDLAESLAGPARDPLAGMIRTEEAERVRVGLGLLPAAPRQVVAPRYGGGLRIREIAATTDLCGGALAPLPSRAARPLRRRAGGVAARGGEGDYATR